MVCNTDESDQKQADYIQMALQQQVDGILLVPYLDNAEHARLIQSQGVPLVVFDCALSGIDVDVVRSDSEAGAYQLVRYLLSLGHRRIAMLSGPAQHFTAAQREAGYRRALAEAGLADAASIFNGAYNLEGGYATMQQVLAAPGPRPTALFTANNFVGLGALQVLREAGLSVPEDMSLACIDDIPLAAMVDPFLTVADQPGYEIGVQGAELLLDRLAGVGPPGPQEIALPTTLRIRKSCRAI
jgi:LacI family transcriptional regulator